MVKIMCIMLPIMLLGALSQKRTDHLKSQGRQDYLYYIGAVIILCLFMGLRTSYNDTTTYIGEYMDPADTPVISVFIKEKLPEMSIGDNPGFRIVNSLLKTIGVNRYGFIMFYSVVIVTISVWFIRKHTENLSFALFRYFTTSYFFAFAGIKQATATAISLIAVDAAISSKWFRYAVFLIIAALFHPYAFIIILAPFLLDKKAWSKTTMIIIGFFVTLGVAFPITAKLLSLLSGIIGDNYSTEDISGTGVNVFRFLTYFACIVYYYIYKDCLYDEDTREQNLFFHLSLLGTMFMFLSLFLNPILIGRIPSYFATFSVISLTYACDGASKKDNSSFNRFIVFTLFLVFFLYEECVSRNFWARYHSIPLWYFIKTLF